MACEGCVERGKLLTKVGQAAVRGDASTALKHVKAIAASAKRDALRLASAVRPKAKRSSPARSRGKGR